MTEEQTEAIKEAYALDSVEYVSANKNGDYQIPAYEAPYCYFILEEVAQYDENTGERLSSPRVKCYSEQVYQLLYPEGIARPGITAEILHDPTLNLTEKTSSQGKAAQQGKKVQPKVSRLKPREE